MQNSTIPTAAAKASSIPPPVPVARLFDPSKVMPGPGPLLDGVATYSFHLDGATESFIRRVKSAVEEQFHTSGDMAVWVLLKPTAEEEEQQHRRVVWEHQFLAQQEGRS